MNLFQLRYFVTLAKMQHYTRAAHELCITQPSLSHAISQLEAELGVALFEKSGRNTTLTSFGEEFLICANRTLATLDSGVSSLQRSARGDGLIRLGMLRSLGISFIPQLAARYLASHPEHDVRFTFHTGSTGGDRIVRHCADHPRGSGTYRSRPSPTGSKTVRCIDGNAHLSTDLFFPRFRYA